MSYLSPVLEATLLKLFVTTEQSVEELDKIKQDLLHQARGYRSKAAFLNEIESFANKHKRKKDVDTKKAKALAREINKTLKNALDNFSVRRSAGKAEEDDDADDMSGSSDDDNSLEIFDGADSASKMLGPYIPTERRMVIA